MGLISTYIAMLDDTERDRVIEAQEWRTEEWGDDAGAPRCLVGHAEDYDGDWELDEEGHLIVTVKATKLSLEAGHDDCHVERTFDTLCERFGLDRVVRAVKLRAALPDRQDRIRRAQERAAFGVGAL